jgi:hypothetical protein
MVQSCGKQFGGFSKLNIGLPYHPVIWLLTIYHKELKMDSQILYMHVHGDTTHKPKR